uniref:Uncharacterized protein n=1 Tax=Arundo donax TaxID=35708 RepID=A0A0A9ER42_ARUDO
MEKDQYLDQEKEQSLETSDVDVVNALVLYNYLL